MPDSATPPVVMHKSWLERLTDLLTKAPQDRASLLKILAAAHEHSVIDADALSMIRGVLQVSQQTVRDVMIPFSQIDMVDISAPVDALIDGVIELGHSRFPAYQKNRDKVEGILLAKDLLRYYQQDDGVDTFDLRDMLRPAVFVPESKLLNVLLRDFRDTHNHLAIVVDEYGSIVGMVTIEDVIEQIVGEIEDEFDFDEEDDHIVRLDADVQGAWRVRGITEIDYFNSHFGLAWSDADADTVGGFIANHLGHVPHLGETVILEGYSFEVSRADGRQVDWFLVRKIPVSEVHA